MTIPTIPFSIQAGSVVQIIKIICERDDLKAGGNATFDYEIELETKNDPEASKLLIKDGDRALMLWGEKREFMIGDEYQLADGELVAISRRRVIGEVYFENLVNSVRAWKKREKNNERCVAPSDPGQKYGSYYLL